MGRMVQYNVVKKKLYERTVKSNLTEDAAVDGVWQCGEEMVNGGESRDDAVGGMLQCNGEMLCTRALKKGLCGNDVVDGEWRCGDSGRDDAVGKKVQQINENMKIEEWERDDAMGGEVQQIDEKLVSDEKMYKEGATTDMVQPGEKAEEMGECGDDAVWRRVQLQDDDRTVQCRNVVVVGRVQQDGEAGSCDRYKCKSGDDATNGVGQFDKDDEVFVREDAETGIQECVRVREGESF